MNDLAKRTCFALALAGVLLFGMVAFVARYFLFSERWVTFQGSPHIYEQGVLDTGKVYDRSGTLVYDTEGKKAYAADSTTRKAMLHLLGDRQGNIPSRVVSHYAPLLVGYDKLSGTYHSTGSGTLTLTVSAQAQAVAMQALNGRKGTVGVYNYKTGEILCAVSSPTFDPDNAPEHIDDATGTYIYRFFHASYTPGSIFKLVTTLAVLESIPDVETRTFTCTGSTTIEGEIIACQKAHGELTFRDALAKSCNCTFAALANEVGARKLSEIASRIGVTDTFEIDGIGTTRGKFDLSGAGKNDIAWAGIGQYTDLVNPCQYMRFMGAIANGGTAAEPYLVLEATCGGEVKYRASTSMTARMLDKPAAAKLQEMMRYNVETIYGAGNFPDVRVCAKSGTAEVGTDANTATFAGFVLDDRYPLAFIVIVEEGGAGSSTCAPIAGAVLKACINVLDGEQN